jgi:hypothetical protein
MGPVAQRVFKTRAVVQPTARSVRLRRRSVEPKLGPLQEEAERLAKRRGLSLDRMNYQELTAHYAEADRNLQIKR